MTDIAAEVKVLAAEQEGADAKKWLEENVKDKSE